ncbi:efflux RND transporter permease subunit [Bacillus sp. APMAM]|nr:efflux RND transporter permease subunit [Bacillus sp. APMAM]RTZ53936.1 efflux RND transporter permease subunit [Bacillus sp. SAJ1]
MKKFIRFFSRRLVLLSVMVMLLFIWGIYSAAQMKTEYLPQINNPILMVTWKSPAETDGVTTDQMNNNLVRSLKEVDGLQSIQSTIYSQGLFASLTFSQNFDVEQAERNIQAAIQQVNFPANVNKPEIQKISSDAFPFMEISASSASFAKQLNEIKGVKKINVTGNGQKGLIVNLDNKKLLENGLRFEDVQNVLQNDKNIWPEGTVATKNLQMMLKVEGTADQKADLENRIIKTANNKQVLLKDIAKIEKGTINVQTKVRTNGKPSVILDLYKKNSADVTKVSKDVMTKLAKIKQSNPDDTFTILSNQGQTVSHAINGLWKEGALGCLFSMLCVFFFFREWRSTAAIALTLPICFLVAVSILQAMGITLNLLTVSGLIVSMGRVVDDSIVVLDNIYRRLEKNGSYSLDLLASAVKEMVPAVVSSTLTTIAVYLPLTMTKNMIGQAFYGLGWAVTISLLCSLVVSILILPPYVANTWRGRFYAKAPKTEKSAIVLLEKVWVHRGKWISGLAVVLILAIICAFFIPVNVLPRTHAQDLNIQVEATEGATLEQVDADVRALEALLQKHKEIAAYSSSVGSIFAPAFDDVFDQGGGWIQQPNIANVYVTPQKGVDIAQLTSILRQDIKNLSTSSKYTITNQKIAGDDSRVNLMLTGDNPSKLAKTAALLRGKLQTIKGLQIYGEAEQSDQERFTIELNEDKINDSGLDKQAILVKLESFLDKRTDIQVANSASSYQVELRKPSAVSLSYSQGSDSEQEWLTQLGHLSFQNKNGETVKLQEFAKLNVDSPTLTSEKDGQPIAVVTGNILTTDIGEVTKQIKDTINKVELPKGIQIEFGGIPQQVQQMIWSIGLAGVVSIILVLFIISCIFKGIRGPVAVLSSLPFALIGSVLFLFIFRQSWNLGALVGMVMLIGIVTTNGIVLVDRLERLREDGEPLKRFIIEGTASRVRPVLMTAATTILTLLPLAFSGQSDTLISQSLGLVVVGGMITSTLASLLVIPTVYYWMWKSVRRTNLLNRNVLSYGD